MERCVDPSTLEYVLKVKKMVVANCEAITHTLQFESELNAWMDEMDKKEEEENE